MKNRIPKLLGLTAAFAACSLAAQTAPTAPKPSGPTSSPVKMEEVEVTGSRIRGLLGDATIQPTMILTAEEIERTGATSLADAFRYIPEITSNTEGYFIQSPNAFGADTGSPQQPRVTATLRGSPAGGTLLLINGRRAPKNGQEFGSTEGYDLSGIPLAAIERIEVLLDGASAIYGNDAVGGVINVILKRGYRNTEIKIGYENTFDGDSHVFTASLTHGFSKGKLSGTITLNNEQSGNMTWKDRDFLRTQDRRQWGGTNGTTAQNPGLNGTINLPAGNSLGLPAATLLTIPSGSSGTNRTAAQFQAAGSPPAPLGTDLAIWAAYNSPYERKSVAANFEYDFKPWITGFVELRGATSHSEHTANPLALNSLSVAATAPGNVFGVPVVIRRFLSDLPIAARWAETTNNSVVVGVKGKLPKGWRFESSFAHVNTRPEYVDPQGFLVNQGRFNTAIADPDPAKRPNVFYDALTPGLNPNAPGLLASIGGPGRQLESDYISTYNTQVNGPLYKTWAGDIGTAFGVEYREEHVRFPLATPGTGTRPRTRYVTGLFTEVRVPFVAEKNKIPLINRLEGTAAFRRDHYQEFPSLTKPRYGVLYRPFTWLMFRGSKGEGYKIPTLNQLYSPATTTTGTIGGAGLADIYRGNEAFIGNQLLTIGGNPNLVPEQTKTETAGMVFDVPGKWFKGWSFSYDFYDYRYVNRIATPTTADRLLIFPDQFFRLPPTAADTAKGWPGSFGPTLTYDGRAVNISVNRITGWDASTKYFRKTPIGDFSLSYNASKTYRNRNQVRIGAPPAVNAVPQALPLRESGSLFWRKGAYETGGLFSYRDVFRTTTTQRFTPSAIRWDWRGSVDFAKTSWARADSERWYKRMFANSRVAVTIFNVFDRNPPMNASGLPDSTIVDARGERCSLTYTKSFAAGVPLGKK
ncbi:MAG: hypothetical protein EXS32_06540 [Opitutus sp.]|nr:hypothetical protein [Opitutus sp.]